MNGSRGWSPRGHLGRSRTRHGAPVPALAGTRPGLGETVRARRPPTPPPAPAGTHARLRHFCHHHRTRTATHRKGRRPRSGAPRRPHYPPHAGNEPRLQLATRTRPEARCPQPPRAGSPWSAVQSGRRGARVATARICQKGLLRGRGTRCPLGEEEQRRAALLGGSIPKCLRGHRDDRRAGPASDRSRGSGGLASDPGCDYWLGHRQPGDLGPPPEAQDGPGTEGDHVTWVRETGSVVLGTWAAARQKEQSLILY